jgi:cell division initiation protein
VPFIAPSEIQNTKLNPALRGYDREQTDELLEQIKASYERVWSEREELRSEVLRLQEQARENDRLRAQLERIEPELEELKKVDQLLRGALVSAERTTEKLKQDARTEAETTVKAARKHADELNTKAEEDRHRLEQEIERLEAIAARTKDECRALLEGALEAIDDSEALMAPKEEGRKLPTPLEHLGEAPLPD